VDSFNAKHKISHDTVMFGDVPMNEVIEYLEKNERGLKITDKNVVVDFIRPMDSFDLTCEFQHKIANHILNRILIESHDVDKCKFESWSSSVEGNYSSWASSVEGKVLVELALKWREANDSSDM
jgi:hypothetical protein